MGTVRVKTLQIAREHVMTCTDVIFSFRVGRGFDLPFRIEGSVVDETRAGLVLELNQRNQRRFEALSVDSFFSGGI